MSTADHHDPVHAGAPPGDRAARPDGGAAVRGWCWPTASPRPARVWGGLDDDLATDHRLVQVDLPGHGRLGHGGGRPVGRGRPSWATAGGRGRLPRLLDGRPLLPPPGPRPPRPGPTASSWCRAPPGSTTPAERAARRRADEALADRLDPVAGGTPAETVAEFVARWVADPMFGGRAAVGRRPSRSGAPTPASGLASSLRLAGTGTQEPLWDRLSPDSTVPVLVVTGARDDKFTALGRRLVASLGGRRHPAWWSPTPATPRTSSTPPRWRTRSGPSSPTPTRSLTGTTAVTAAVPTAPAGTGAG